MLIFKPVVAIMVSDPINEITKTYYPGEILTFEVRRIGLDGIETITGRFLSYDESRNEIDLDTSVTYGNAITRIKADAIHSVKRQASDIIKDGLAGNVIIPAPVLTPAKKIHEGEDLTKPPAGQDSGKTEPPKTEGGSKTIDEKPTVKLVDGVPIYVDGKKYIPVMALIPDEKVHIATPSPLPDDGKNTQTPAPDHTETPNPQPNNGDEHKKVEGDTNDNNAHSTDNGSTGDVNGGHETGVGSSGDLHNQSGQTGSPEKKESTPEQGEHTPTGTTEQGGVSGTPAVPPSGVTEENKEHTES